MSAVMYGLQEDDNSPPPMSICPRCGRQVRLDGRCDCEMLFENSSSDTKSKMHMRRNK